MFSLKLLLLSVATDLPTFIITTLLRTFVYLTSYQFLSRPPGRRHRSLCHTMTNTDVVQIQNKLCRPKKSRFEVAKKKKVAEKKKSADTNKKVSPKNKKVSQKQNKKVWIQTKHKVDTNYIYNE